MEPLCFASHCANLETSFVNFKSDPVISIINLCFRRGVKLVLRGGEGE